MLDDGECVLRFVPSGLRPAAFVWLLVLAFGLLGAAGVLIGLGIAAWVGYNVFVERQPEFRGDPLSLQPLGIAPLLVIGRSPT